MEYRLGVIGGMGPQATSVFLQKVIENTEASRDQEHINTVILNHSTLMDRTNAIMTQQGELFLDSILKDIKLLEHIGVAHIAIPCNTSHYFIEDMRDQSKIPIINMVEETVKKVYESIGQNCKIGILATSGTIMSEVYKRECEKYGLEYYVPNEELQRKTMELIYDSVKSGRSVGTGGELEGIISELLHQEGCNCVILACTELSCIPLIPEISQYCVDAMDVLVERAITLSGKNLKKKIDLVRFEQSGEVLVSS